MYSSISSQLAMYNSRTKQKLPTPETPKVGATYQPLNAFFKSPQAMVRSSLSPMMKPSLLPVRFDKPDAPRGIKYPPMPPPIGLCSPTAVASPIGSANIFNGPIVRQSERKHRIFDKSNSPLSRSRGTGAPAGISNPNRDYHRVQSYISTNSIRSNRFYNPATDEKQDTIPRLNIPSTQQLSDHKSPRSESSERRNARILDNDILNQIESRIVLDRGRQTDTAAKPSSQKETASKQIEDLAARRNNKQSKTSENPSEHGSEKMQERHQRFFDSHKSNFHAEATAAPRQLVYFQREARSEKDLKGHLPANSTCEGLFSKLDPQTKAIALLVLILVVVLLLYELVK